MSLRHRKSACQKILHDFQEKPMNVIQIRDTQNYAFKYIGNTDDTAVYFDMRRSYTVHVKCKRP
jgi:hypothetical protein